MKQIQHLLANDQPAAATLGTSPEALAAMFNPPLETLLESLEKPSETTIHDIQQAYNMLSGKIRARIHNIISDQSCPALLLFKQSAPKLVQVVLRDVGRALLDPTEQFRCKFAGHHIYATEKRRIRDATDSSTVCHQALRLLSDLLRFPVFVELLSENEVSTLIHSLLNVALSPSLPSFNAKLTRTLVVWIFQVQHLPQALLYPHTVRIHQMLSVAISGTIGKQQARLDGLKAIHNLLRRDPTVWLPSLHDLLKQILPLLTSEQLVVRLNAAFALAGFAHAKMNTIPASRNTLRLSQLLFECLTTTSASHNGPFWATTVLASLIVLIDFQLIPQGGTSLRLCINSLSAMYKRVKLLQPYVWRCLVWTAFRIPPAEFDHDVVFKMISQELTGGVGAAIAMTLLHLEEETVPEHLQDHYKNQVSKAVTLLHQMLHSKVDAIRKDGTLLLGQLLGETRSRRGSATDIIVRQELFTSKLLSASDLESALGSLKPNIEVVRCLSQTEILLHYDALLENWTFVVNGLLNKAPWASIEAIITSWQSLLLARGQSREGERGASWSDDFVDKTGALISSFVRTESEDPNRQARHLSVVKKLWQVMTNTFGVECFQAPAQTIITTILGQTWNMGDRPVAKHWVEVSMSLAQYCDGFAAIMSKLSLESLDTKRHLWTAIVKILTTRPKKGILSLDDMVAFVQIPYCEWTMSPQELALWDALLKLPTVEPSVFVERLFQGLEPLKVQRVPKESLRLFFHADFSKVADLPVETLSRLDNILLFLYSSPDQHPTALEYLQFVIELVSKVSKKNTLALVIALHNGFYQWFKDPDQRLTDDEYNEVAMKLYCHTLDVLAQLRPAKDLLRELGDLLTVPFYHVRQGALGIEAFKRFWLSTYHEVEEFWEWLPPCIKEALRLCDYLHGEDLLAGDLTDSLMDESFAIPESQRSPRHTPSQISVLRYGLTSLSPKSGRGSTVSPGYRPLSLSRSPMGPSVSPLRQLRSQAASIEVSAYSKSASTRLRTAPLKRAAESLEAGPSKIRKTSRSSKQQESTSSSHHSSGSGRRRMVFDGVEIIVRRSQSARRESQLMTPDPSASPPSSPQEDYASWEIAIADDQKENRQEEDEPPDSSPILASPSFRSRSKRRDRSHTAPTLRPFHTVPVLKPQTERSKRRLASLAEMFTECQQDSQFGPQEFATASRLGLSFVNDMNEQLYSTALGEG
ncbi:hypothetical protein C8J56DRAFT_1074385 [Mycena floridula]|nr:hypothetical protein C8J56DRAFT_1074385 [Mycena floridula]